MMRLVYDLFPCQTGSRFRGIGRFTMSLLEAMARSPRGHAVHALANDYHPESVEDLRRALAPVLPPGRFATYGCPNRGQLGGDQQAHARASSALIQHAYQSLTPDAVLYATPFEGWGEDGVVAIPEANAPGALRTAVLYDFIPWLFPDQYLHTANGYRPWYERRLMALHRFDLLLAISEATRRDAIDILGIPPERVVNISGAATARFRPMTKAEQGRQNIGRFGIVRPFVLYTGNADYRKNLHGMLKAYSLLPLEVRKTHQLVLNQVGADIIGFRRGVRELGLSDDEVVVTGHITDEELTCLYTQCALFVFPSLYEGFGLPILEAMACGAPVIAADNSSIPEVMGRSDVLFDAARPDSIADAMARVLTDAALRAELRAYSLDRATLFSWDRSANLAWDAIEEATRALRASQGAGADARKQARIAPRRRPRIAVVCNLQSDADPSARHCIDALPALGHDFDIDLYTESGKPVAASLLQASFDAYPHTALPGNADRYATVIYQLADSAQHAFMLPLLAQVPGALVLHDKSFGKAFGALGQATGMPDTAMGELFYSQGLRGFLEAMQTGAGGDPKPTVKANANRRLLEFAQHVILPDEGLRPALDAACGSTWLPPLTILPAEREHRTASYASAIEQSIACSPRHTARALVDALATIQPSDQLLGTLSHYADHNWRLRRQPRLLIDTTQLTKVDAFSGIQRVVKKIAYEVGHMQDGEVGLPVELVHLKDGRLHRACAVTASVFGLERGSVPEEALAIHPGDTLLMLDSSWEQYSGFLPVFDAVRRAGGKVVTAFYDLIPLRYPEMCAAPLVQVFRQWVGLAAQHSDALVCISRAVADDVAAYLAEHQLSRPGLDITWWHLGADLAARHADKTIRPLVENLVADTATPLFLMVGTIEPRKGHAFALDAFELLWREGLGLRLCIIGKEGWKVEETMQRLRNHPELGKRLVLIENASDEEIERCYAASTALIAASTTEGFGLPIVEAALHKIPVLASDIPVFREVGGEGARYFSLKSPASLADAVKEMHRLPAAERFELALRIKTLTWRQSALQLLERIGINARNADPENAQ
ncbi:glycosyltransferase family 4 protein [Noviherbaspirillum galbum]|uniref:Glycosyltransferase family 4 protein n=1 Tax=Noviherbaspirillum galbum TaxID=2709383 RepID=A0A6B3STE1_9BURK|nr:glycosyltransferase family 1 protein [Noviherbaspirillum galbum]NEX60889.1 glycosyltransferase family 4 protein [Noviherbaspirillum galbum]